MVYNRRAGVFRPSPSVSARGLKCLGRGEERGSLPSCWVYPNSAVLHYSPPHQDPARTCRTRRDGAGATGLGHGRVGVPRAATAAAAAPSSAASECRRACALARCARAALALRSRCAGAALALRCTHAGLREAGAVGSPRRRRQLPLLISPLLLSLCRHHSCQLSRARARSRARSLART